MPDITMCGNNMCKMKEQCKRHKDSGTKPDMYQSYAMFGLHDGDCEFYMEKRNDTTTK